MPSMEARYCVDLRCRTDGSRVEGVVRRVAGRAVVRVVVWIGVLYEALVDWTQGTRAVLQ
jgi:hypothetical protein